MNYSEENYAQLQKSIDSISESYGIVNEETVRKIRSILNSYDEGLISAGDTITLIRRIV